MGCSELVTDACRCGALAEEFVDAVEQLVGVGQEVVDKALGDALRRGPRLCQRVVDSVTDVAAATTTVAVAASTTAGATAAGQPTEQPAAVAVAVTARAAGRVVDGDAAVVRARVRAATAAAVPADAAGAAAARGRRCGLRPVVALRVTLRGAPAREPARRCP
jgi:hypothetical protein